MTEELRAVLRRNLSAALRSGELETARTILARLEEEDPVALETRGLRLELLLRSGALGEAEALARQLLALFPASPRVALLAGETAYKRKDYAAAASRLEESERLAASWRTRRLLGQTLTQAGRFAEAEPLLLSLVDEHPECGKDLAWLYERMGDAPRAIRWLTAVLTRNPGDPAARRNLSRLSAWSAPSEEVVADVEGLLALGEEVPAELLAPYCEALLKTARGARAREFVRGLAGLSPRDAVALAWVFYHGGSQDLAYDLFRIGLPANLHNVKLLSALEQAATRCRRLDDLLASYAGYAPSAPALYGRMKALRRRIGT